MIYIIYIRKNDKFNSRGTKSLFRYLKFRNVSFSTCFLNGLVNALVYCDSVPSIPILVSGLNYDLFPLKLPCLGSLNGLVLSGLEVYCGVSMSKLVLRGLISDDFDSTNSLLILMSELNSDPLNRLILSGLVSF